MLPTFNRDPPDQHPHGQRRSVEVTVAITPLPTFNRALPTSTFAAVTCPNSFLNRTSAHVTDTLHHIHPPPHTHTGSDQLPSASMAAPPTKDTLYGVSRVPVTRSTAKGISVLMVYIKMLATKCWEAPA